jgi:hypothetical protein
MDQALMIASSISGFVPSDALAFAANPVRFGTECRGESPDFRG